MFNVVVAGVKGRPFKVIIEDCPRNGVEAIDFRRQMNLSPAPSNEIELPILIFEDEHWVRLHVDKANSEADILLTQQRQQTFTLNASGGVYKQNIRMVDSGWLPLIPSWAISDYFNNPCPLTAQQFMGAFWQGEARSLQKCKEEQEKFAVEQQAAEKAKADARLLLASEFDVLNRRVESLNKKIEDLTHDLCCLLQCEGEELDERLVQTRKDWDRRE